VRTAARKSDPHVDFHVTQRPELEGQVTIIGVCVSTT
jgi:hypothetical protein